MQGAELAELMFDGGKVIENRKQLGLGWWVVYVGKDQNWRTTRWAVSFKEVLDTVPVDESLAAYYGCAVAFIYLSEYRAKVECHGYRWAGEEPGQVCHVVSHAIKFQTPLQIKTCLLYTSPSPRDLSTSRMPSSA